MPIAHDDSRPVRVLVVDDSRLLRSGMRAIFERAGLVVIGECASGMEAIGRVAALRPDVITVDLDMPGLDGMDTIERIMAEHPTPIVVVTADPKYRGYDGHFEALARGAIDLVLKPSRIDGTDPESLRIIEVIRTVAGLMVVPHVRGSPRRRKRSTLPLSASTRVPLTESAPALIAIGASTGGPGAIRAVLDGLGNDLPVPIIVVQHMAEEFAEGFVRWLQSQVAMPVHEATPGARMRPGRAYIAVRGAHLRVASDGIIEAAPGPPSPHRPSIDALFVSIANRWGRRGVGILLTGMGEDGALGLSAIHAAGGMTIAQDEETSVVFGMPGAAIERGAARLVLPLDAIARITRDICRDEAAFTNRGESS